MVIAALVMISGDSAAAQTREPAALIVSVTGSPALLRSGARLPVRVGTPVEAGDSIVLPQNAAVQLLHSSGRLEGVTTSMRIGTTPPSPAGLFRRSLRTLASIATTDPRAVLNREGMIRPIPGSAVAIAPRNAVLVADTRPAFAWFAVPEATGYILQLRADDGRAIRFETGRDTVWTPPQTLSPGVTYEWTVAALPDGRPALPQRFRTATEQERSAVSGALEAIYPPAGPADVDALLLSALELREAGFMYDARAALDALFATGVPLEPPVHLLHAMVLAALGDTVQAAAALRRAEQRQ